MSTPIASRRFASERELRASLRLTAGAYHKAQARYAAHPSAKHARKLAARRADLQAALAAAAPDSRTCAA